jgi:hypothetical protein
VQLATVGHRIDLGTPADGIVLAVHDRAVNLVVGGRLWTLLPATGLPGPRRLLLARFQLGLPIRTGDDVHVRAGRLALGDVVADGRAAAVWTPPPLPPASGGVAARLAAVDADGAWPGVRPRIDRLVAALLAEGPGSRAAREALAGLLGAGPGLTPSGDDALLGLVAGLTGIRTPVAAETLAWLRSTPATTWTRTTTLSGLLLRDALDGDLAEPLVSLVAAIRVAADTRSLLAEVLAVGATSGADTSQGLAAAGRLLTPPIARPVPGPITPAAERDVA